MIHHVAVETRRSDTDACVEFFALLGFEEVEPPESLRDRARWVQRGPTQVHLMFESQPVVPPAGHLAVSVDDYPATLEALRAAGHPVQERQAHWGSPRAFAHDPAGHVVEVMAFPP